MNRANYRYARNKMVEYLKNVIGIQDENLLKIFKEVPRELFIDSALSRVAYQDISIPIGYDQTISKPSTVAKMLQALRLKPTYRVLEIGTGSGYQTAILAKMVDTVYSIELIPLLSKRTSEILKELNMNNVLLKTGDGLKGWKDFQPYNSIIFSAFLSEPPHHLVPQINPRGGKIVYPMGNDEKQKIYLMSITDYKMSIKMIDECQFVPLLKSDE